ncbi:transcriptional repressor NF-X1 isoform X2 [Frankliniella occidentalis]|uniref:Transcriptional repressor NF-X1 isoform X2 n=1 Tax=Frankliniella occidentalis TaxID=133901 RepID=A0A9C6U411_FRAOC|nr:transcriptional repressor NF-X1 isoform X2 [Frankliniella occidentalis]
MLTTTQRKHNWDTCIVRSQCKEVTCSECGPDDKGCADMCRMNCECGCGGHPRGGMDHDLWKACNQARNCRGDFMECRESCRGNKDCVVRCELVHNLCYCGCVQTALTTTQRKHDWDTCVVKSQCHNKTCSECTGAYGLCAERCARRCECGCAGHPRSDLSGEWEECFVGTQSCEEAHSDCLKGCHEQKCGSRCELDLIKCRCDCRSATEAEWLMWTECKEKDECGRKTCSECGEDDMDCAHRCQRNCECHRCLGIAADNMDDLSVQECKIKSGCHIAYKKCQEKCKAAEGDEECDHSCLLASEKCHCKCAQTSATETSEGERREIIQHCNYLG